MSIFRIAVTAGASFMLTAAWAGGERATEFTQQGSVINTRHNMTFRGATGNDLLSAAGSGASVMDFYRNDYRQVCVYCHTPHAANASVAAPLWNRNIPATTYTTYNQLNTALSQTVYQPGAASLACLSCHDGQQAVDAIMNMPGSGAYSATPDFGFLNTWALNGGNEADHASLNISGSNNVADPSCLSCHEPGVPTAAANFRAAAIGTDLRDDHPVGVTFPASNGVGTDWKTPTGTKVVGGRTHWFFDDTPNGRLEKNEIRLYDNGNGPVVECGSCHDPHGVPSNGAGTVFNPTFLRKTNSGSAVCLTCHAK